MISISKATLVLKQGPCGTRKWPIPIQILYNDGHVKNYLTARTLILNLGSLCYHYGFCNRDAKTWGSRITVTAGKEEI